MIITVIIANPIILVMTPKIKKYAPVLNISILLSIILGISNKPNNVEVLPIIRSQITMMFKILDFIISQPSFLLE